MRENKNMKRIYVNEDWCLGCHLCEYNCAFANSGLSDMALALKGKPIYPRIHVEGNEKISYAVSCRHCVNPICVKSCIAGALSLYLYPCMSLRCTCAGRERGDAEM